MGALSAGKSSHLASRTPCHTKIWTCLCINWEHFPLIRGAIFNSTQLKFIKTGSSKAEHTNNNLYRYSKIYPEQRTHRPITSQYPLETTICTHSIHKQCTIGMFFLRLLFWQLLLKLLRFRFLNRSYPGTPPFRCRQSRPYHEEPRLKKLFYPILSALASLFLHCSPMVTFIPQPALESPTH